MGGKIAESDYRMWFKLNNKTNISVLTLIGETEKATIMNGIGQGSFGAALASSLNIGCGIDMITKGICTARIGELELNALIFQDDIAKMNYSMEQTRKGATDVGRLLESKQLRANTSKSKFVIIGTESSRTDMLKDAASNPVMMGETVIENSDCEKYLSDMIHENGCAASIAATIKARKKGALEATHNIISDLNHPALRGHRIAEVAVTEYASKVTSKLISNCESWIDLTEDHIDDLQNMQDNFFKNVFHVRPEGTPLCMVRLDSQTFHVRYQIVQRKINRIRKVMDADPSNYARKALIEGQKTCANGDLLTECIEWCKKFKIRCVTRGTNPIKDKAKYDEFMLKKGLWRENDKDIKIEKDELSKVRDIEMPTKKYERNYLAKQAIANARIWFRYRSKIISDIKGNQSSKWTGQMHCRHCNLGCDETQEHIEKCTGFSVEREKIDLSNGEGKLVFWRRVVYKLKYMKLNDETFSDVPNAAVDSSTCVTSEGQADMPVNTSVPDKEILERGPEGPRISAGDALGARDMSVGEVAQVTLRNELFHTGY